MWTGVSWFAECCIFWSDGVDGCILVCWILYLLKWWCGRDILVCWMLYLLKWLCGRLQSDTTLFCFPLYYTCIMLLFLQTASYHMVYNSHYTGNSENSMWEVRKAKISIFISLVNMPIRQYQKAMIQVRGTPTSTAKYFQLFPPFLQLSCYDALKLVHYFSFFANIWEVMTV